MIINPITKEESLLKYIGNGGILDKLFLLNDGRLLFLSIYNGRSLFLSIYNGRLLFLSIYDEDNINKVNWAYLYL